MSRARAALLVAVIAVCHVAAWRAASADGGQGPSTILVSSVRGTITPVIADHLEDGVRRAQSGGHHAYLVEIDTPGGLDTAMREIVTAFLNAPVPVLVYVGPSGSRAASAGALIALSAHVVGMAPGTTIGAATPVDLQGGEISDKVINDAAAYAEAIAAARGRDTSFASDIVRKGRAVTAGEAERIGVADVVAQDRAAFLRAVDGRVVSLPGRPELRLDTSGAPAVAHDLGGFRRLLQILADPNLAFLFLSLGSLAIVYEFANPGMGAGGIAGVILLVLAMFALSVLPVNVAGLLLVVLALALFVTELFVPGIGVFAAGGTASLLLGGIFLFRGPLGVSLGVLVPVAVLVGAGALLAARLAWRSRRLRRSSGPDALLGATAVVKRWSGTSGQVFAEGAWWSAVSDEQVDVGDEVRIASVDGLTLTVVRPDGRAGGTDAT